LQQKNTPKPQIFALMGKIAKLHGQPMAPAPIAFFSPRNEILIIRAPSFDENNSRLVLLLKPGATGILHLVGEAK
jgi:hypothetical protein